MPPKRAVKSTSRRNTPQSPPKPASSSGSPKQTRRSGRAPRDGGSVELSLQPVAEEESIEVAGGPESSSSSSEASLESLDPDTIVESLAGLHRESLNIIQFFEDTTPDSITGLFIELQDLSSKRSRKFRRHLSKFIPDREPLSHELYIDPSLIIRSLRGEEALATLQDGKWRPDAIIYLANVAQLLAYCFLSDEDDDRDFRNLTDLRNFFPHIFSATEPSSRLRTSFAELAVEFSNAFRTQYFIQISKRRIGEAEFDPDAVLTELFPETGPNSGIEIAGDLLPLAVETRLQEIKKHVTTNSKSPVKIGPLEKAFPWTEFLAQTAKFAVARTQELEAQIAAQGGVENIVECNEDKNFSPLDPDTRVQAATARAALEQGIPIDPQLTQGASAKKRQGRPNLSGQPQTGEALTRDIAYLKNLKAAKAARGSGNKTAPPRRRGKKAQEIQQSPQMDVDMGAGPPPMDDELFIPSQMTALVQATLESHQRESSKENIGPPAAQRSFLDKQNNASKVPFGETQAEKRPHEEEEDDDAEFQDDTRPAKRRARIEQGQASTQPARSPLRPLPASSLPPSTAPAAFQEGEFPPSQQWAEANAIAKTNAQAYREQHRDEKLQVRKPWAIDEVERLMTLIELNGPKYSKILQDDKSPDMFPEGPILQHRTQVQLKDKARNIKLDFLK